MRKFFETELGQKIIRGVVAILRNGVLVAAGLIITNLIAFAGSLQLDPTIQWIVVGALKAIDELLHKTGVAEKGIVRF